MADSACKLVFGTTVEAKPLPRVRTVNRDQLLMMNLDIEQLIPEDHSARAIWELVGRLDLRAFYAAVKAVEGHAGQPPFDPRLMISIWVYGISRGVNSGRELSAWCEWEPGLQWLCAMDPVNYHSLSTFRTAHEEALKRVFIDMLGVLKAEGLVKLERVTVDGTRIRTQSSNEGYRSGEKLEEHLKEVAEHIEAIAKEPEEPLTQRRQAARERSRRELQERVAAAQAMLVQLQQERGAKAAKEVQLSVTEPEGRIMKQPGSGGFAPSFNLQLAVDSEAKIIVAALLSNNGADTKLLAGVLDEVKGNCGAQPRQVVVDGGYVSAGNLAKTEEMGVDMIGPVADTTAMVNKQAQQRGVSPAYFREAFRYEAGSDTYECPQGKTLVHIKQRLEESGSVQHEYRAKRSDCAGCAHKQECCPQTKTRGRTIVRSEPCPQVKAFREKMQTEEYKKLYRQRSEVAEFPNAWLKEKLGLRRFRLRGQTKAGIESLWAVITYNVQQWIRLVQRPRLAAAGA